MNLDNLNNYESKLYKFLIKTTKRKPHNITKYEFGGINYNKTYKRALSLKDKGLCRILDLGHRVSITALIKC